MHSKLYTPNYVHLEQLTLLYNMHIKKQKIGEAFFSLEYICAQKARPLHILKTRLQIDPFMHLSYSSIFCFWQWLIDFFFEQKGQTLTLSRTRKLKACPSTHNMWASINVYHIQNSKLFFHHTIIFKKGNLFILSL